MVPPEKNEVRFRTSVLNMGLLICPTTGGDKLTEEGTDQSPLFQTVTLVLEVLRFLIEVLRAAFL